MPRKPLTEEEKTVVRRRACAAAKRIIEAQGLTGLTIRAVAREIDMSAMSLYTYFESKADLVSYLQAKAFSALAHSMETAEEAANSPEDALRALGHVYSRYAKENVNDFRLAFTVVDDEGQMSPRALEEYRRAMAPLSRVVADVARNSGKACNPDDMATAIWAAWHGHATLSATGCLPIERPDIEGMAMECEHAARIALPAAE